MSKLKLIIAREYLSRVRKRTFILTTILTPIGFLLFFIATIFIATSNVDQKKILIIDDAELLGLDSAALKSNAQVNFIYKKSYRLSDLLDNFEQQDFDAILHLPREKNQGIEQITELQNFNTTLYAQQQLGVAAQTYIKSRVAKRIEAVKLKRFGLDQSLLERAYTGADQVSIKPIVLGKDSQSVEIQSSNRIYVATFLGGMMMFLIYLVIIIYGNMVMRSVMEEKTSRIVEIIVSSVKPFTLMLGKIIGVGAVGLTQFAIWGLTIPLLNLLVGLLFAGRVANLQEGLPAQEMTDSDMELFFLALQELWTFNYLEIFFFFILFFLAGYILYASLFAAIGAAMGDDWGEGQSLTLVVVIPVILAFYVGVAVIEDPNSSLGVFASIFPLFSPVVMPARIVFEPPLWQILLSVSLLLLNCWLFVWLSGRIYRAGILMYGKKTTLRELVKWIFMKE